MKWCKGLDNENVVDRHTDSVHDLDAEDKPAVHRNSEAEDKPAVHRNSGAGIEPGAAVDHSHSQGKGMEMEGNCFCCPFSDQNCSLSSNSFQLRQ